MSDSEHDSDDENIDGSSSEDSVNQSGDDSSTDSSIEEPTVMQSDSGKDASSADDQTASMGAFGHIPNLQSRLGDYVLTREIGRGGMGVVFEASEVSLRRQVALKILPVLAQDDGTYLQRFENESRAAAQLNHPDIVPVYGVGRQDGVCYFAMKLIEGRNLSQVIKSIRTELSTGINANSETPPLGKFPTAADNPNAAPATQKANIGPHHDPGSRTAASNRPFADQDGVRFQPERSLARGRWCTRACGFRRRRRLSPARRHVPGQAGPG